MREAEAEQRKAAADAEQESLDLPAAAPSNARRAVDAQKEKALAALRSAAEADRRRLEAIEGELASAFEAELSSGELKQREGLQAEVKRLSQRRVKAERDAAKAEQQRGRLEGDLRDNLQQRQQELQRTLDEQTEEERRASTGGAVDPAAAQQRLAATAAELESAHKGLGEKRVEERRLREELEQAKGKLAAERTAQQEEAKELDKMLARRGVLQSKAQEFADCIRRLGSLPKESFDESRRALSSKQLMGEIEQCNKELQKLGHVNKKALDQFQSFNEQRDKLIDRRDEVEKAEESIRSLIEHLDLKKDEAMERTFKGIAKHFTEVFRELVPGGAGKLIMKTSHEGKQLEPGAPASSRIAAYQGISIRVQFAGGAATQTMQQLSGGQKTMVALCLIFAIQRCDPAPFYIFDEIDANLDAAHRSSLAQMIERQASRVNEESGDPEPTQFITTTFRPELIHTGDKFYGVTHRNKASTIKSISKADALRIISEDQNRQRQHA
uniref:RecF/RecN/SMC N-terminal domain-containing protein n=1 Tax=Emiliania huxleyi TaxID=2903 RepID=A0A7S3W759_EMIHU|mmetsp:Transcript_25475/g.75887  ORF Transcript_25475/g.75887 Transcript_25475/m.75887 type:complete len:499 (+) Transcript_25475:970-2466(+)